MNPSLDNVHERLETALARIDNALVGTKPDDGIADELKKMTAEHVALRDRHQEISDRLDAAIGRLRLVLRV